jgi:radical SAM superfamily enzyme YgiQ (UPF0313 family)
VINKVIPEEVLMETAAIAFQRGWSTLKLYFMISLPDENLEDVRSIVTLIEKVYNLGRELAGHRLRLGISLSTFVPKPHTPFQWTAQDSEDQIILKHDLVKDGIARRGLKVSWQDPKTSLLEAVISRGDRKIGQVILKAWKSGSTFDAWSEHFKWENWQKAFAECNLDPAFYAKRARNLDEILPWSIIDIGVSTEHLKREYNKALAGQETGDCRYTGCHACGFQSSFQACQDRLSRNNT